MLRYRIVLASLILWLGQLPAAAAVRQLASSGPFTASIETAETRIASGPLNLRVDAAQMAAFADDPESHLRKLLAASRTIIQAERIRSVPETATLAGFADGKQVYWGGASFQREWQIITTFNLPDAIDRLEFLPTDLSGFLTLYYYQGKQRETTKGEIPLYDQALKAKAESLTAQSLKGFRDYVASLEKSFDGIEKVADVSQRFLLALTILPVDRTAEIGAIEDAAIKLRGDLETEALIKRLREQKPNRWDEILLLPDQFTNGLEKLSKWELQDAYDRLDEAIFDHCMTLLESAPMTAQFTAELEGIPMEISALPALSDLAQTLESHPLLSGALEPYIEKVQLRMGQILLKRIDTVTNAIASSGKSVYDIADLLQESAKEAEIFDEWGHGDLAAVIHLAALARGDELAETGFAPFAAELKRLSGTTADIETLREKVLYLRNTVDEVGALKRHQEQAESRLAELIYEKDASVYTRLDVPKSMSGQGVNIAGKILSLAELAENLEANGQTLKKAGVGSHYPSGSSSVMGLLGWTTPKQAINSITIAREDGAEIEFSVDATHAAQNGFSPNIIRHDGAEEPLHESEWVQLALDLGAIVPTGIPNARGVTDSDRFASDPADAGKRVESGILTEDLNAEVAITASMAAIEHNPAEPRYKFHMGRALLAAGEKQEAIRFLNDAYADGYAAAAFHLGTITFDELLAPEVDITITKLRQTVAYFEAAEKGGYTDAAASLKDAKEMLDLFMPPFDQQSFQYSIAIRAFFTGETGWFFGLSPEGHRYLKFYCLGMRSIAAMADESFAKTKTASEIQAFTPAVIQRARNNPAGFVNTMSQTDFWEAAQQSLAAEVPLADGYQDIATLYTFMNEDKVWKNPFWENVLNYLRKYHSARQ